MAAGGSDLAAELVAALDEAARLLEGGDPQAAALAMASAVGRCQTTPPGALGPAAIDTARRLLDRCRQAEAQLRKKVAAEMASLGASRRAVAAYER